VIENVIVWPASGSVTVGVNEYAWLTVAVVGGVPLIRGAVLGGAETVMVNAGSEAESRPSDTLITMPAWGPVSVEAGVPDSRPVAGLKLAHAGLPAMENVSVWPASESLAVGVNEYAWPAVTDVCGVPLIRGALCATESTTIAKAGSAALSRPSDTLIRMPECVPTFVAAGVPVSCPVVELKFAQAGLPVIA
jgi:hypothetical protein